MYHLHLEDVGRPIEGAHRLDVVQGLLLSLLLLHQLLELDLGLRKLQSLGKLMLLYLEHCQKLRFRLL